MSSDVTTRDATANTSTASGATDIAISASDLGKTYYIGEVSSRYRTLGELLTRIATWPWGVVRRLAGQTPPQAGNRAKRTIDALDDVSFEIRRGEVVGIIGSNGAGKSTLLKVLSRITEPSRGEVRISGRVGVLLEVGTGFHSELTGRENILLNGAILGMGRREIEAKMDDIVAFAGVETFIDSPVKFYSSGMELRLGFSVAAHLEPEILLVDEVLAVGDAEFQRRCLAKMDGVARAGRTVVLVSHNMAAIKKLCQKTLWIDHGRLKMFGDTDSVVAAYLAQASGEPIADVAQRTDRRGNGPVRLSALELTDSDGRLSSLFPTGSTMNLLLAYSRETESEGGKLLPELLCTIRVYDQFRNLVFSLGNHLTGEPFLKVPDHGRLQASVPRLMLVPGRYSITVLLHVSNHTSDHLETVCEFDVVDSNFLGGTIPMRTHVYGSTAMPHDWRRLE